MQTQTTRRYISPCVTRISRRRGIATLWVIVSLPVLLTLLIVLIDVSNIWIAKIELRNATDAAALSGSKTWGEGGSTAQVRLDANDAFSTNTILGNAFALNTAQGGCTNGNIISTGELVLGSTTDAGSVITFDCNGTPACVGGDAFAVRARKTVQISSVANNFFGMTLGPYDVTTESFARFQCNNGPPQLMHVDLFLCTCP
jgi:uncharacterized membrane protein